MTGQRAVLSNARHTITLGHLAVKSIIFSRLSFSAFRFKVRNDNNRGGPLPAVRRYAVRNNNGWEDCPWRGFRYPIKEAGL